MRAVRRGRVRNEAKKKKKKKKKKNGLGIRIEVGTRLGISKGGGGIGRRIFEKDGNGYRKK